ncbi:hypothetical protein EDB19DRAFT_1672884, partial [Suillus lakei]
RPQTPCQSMGGCPENAGSLSRRPLSHHLSRRQPLPPVSLPQSSLQLPPLSASPAPLSASPAITTCHWLQPHSCQLFQALSCGCHQSASRKSPTILSAPPNMPPSFFAGLQMQPAPLHAAGTLAFPRPLKWEAVAQERVPSAASLWHCVVHVACTIVALISRVIVYGCGYEYARWRGIPFTRRFSCCSMMRRRDSRGRKCSVDWEYHVGWCQQLCLPAMQLVILCSHVHLVRET